MIARNLDPPRGGPRARRTRARARRAGMPPNAAHAATRAHVAPDGALSANVAELAAILARGALRAVLSGGYPGSPNPLALRADHEPCSQANADTRQRTPTPARANGEHA